MEDEGGVWSKTALNLWIPFALKFNGEGGCSKNALNPDISVQFL